MTNTPPTPSKTLSCPWCDFESRIAEVAYHFHKHASADVNYRLAELIVQEGKIKAKIEQRIKELERDRDREHDWVVDRVQSELKALLK